jgi:hypothetical protein
LPKQEELTIVPCPSMINELSKSNILKSVIFDIKDMMIDNKPLAKNYNKKVEVSGLTPKKRMSNSRNLELEEIDKKVNRLIYRHKTLSQAGQRNE